MAYYSRQLSKQERSYSTTEREALAAVAAVKEFYSYLYGREFTLVTDHNPLVTLTKLKDPTGRLARWITYLQQSHYSFVYRAGNSHANADSLSRSTALAMVATITEVLPKVDIRSHQLANPEIAAIIQALECGGTVPDSFRHQTDRLIVEEGVLYRRLHPSVVGTERWQTVIPPDLRRSVFQQLHDRSGHLGYAKTFQKIQERVYWPSYSADIKFWVKGCPQCQYRNAPPTNTKAPVVPIQTSRPFQKISWDIMGPLPPSSRGNRYILVVTDLFTKWVEAFPLKETSSETLARTLFDEVICRYGVPEELHSDQGKNLCSSLIQCLCEMLGIRRTNTTAYHPQGNGQTERFNRTLESILAKLLQDNTTQWDDQIPQALFAYRTSLHESTRFSPFLLMFGRSPNLPIDVMLGKSNSRCQPVPEFVETIQEKMPGLFNMAKEHLSVAQAHQKQCHDNHSQPRLFQVGAQVLLYTPVVPKGSIKKFASHWKGPFIVLNKLSDVNYRIQSLTTGKKSNVHVNRLKPYWDANAATPSSGDAPTFMPRTTDDSGSVAKAASPPQPVAVNPTPRSKRTCRAPDRYGTYVSH